jgi:hypothetical protein
MVREMLARGIAADVIVLAVEAAEQVMAPRSALPIDETAERRRAKDRDRKRSTRDQRLPESEWFPLVVQVINRDGNLCQYCGDGGNLTADHVVPMSRGGTHDSSNLVACCIPCNSKKSNRLLCEWLPDPQKSADEPFVSAAAKAAIIRETSAEVRRSPQTSKTPLTLSSLTSSEPEIKKEKKVRARATPCPPEFQPKQSHFEAAEKLGIPRQAVFDKCEDMRIWALSKGELKADWDMTLHGFLRRDADKLKSNKSVHDAARNQTNRAMEYLRQLDEPGGTRDAGDAAGGSPLRLLSSR